MLGELALGLGALYAGGTLYGRLRPDLPRGPYPSPQAVEREIDALAERHPQRARIETIGHSREGRPIRALRLSAGPGPRPRLLVTAHIHAVEYIGAFAARTLARLLADGYGHDPVATRLLDRAEVCLVTLLNPDGAERVWRRGGWSGLGWSRFTAGGVDPNRNFPYREGVGRRSWNSGRGRPGSAYYRGPHPLSEPECLALARLAKRERFCAAVNFHSFGGVIYMPEPQGEDREKVRHVLEVFQGIFQDHQPGLRYRPVPERASAISGQLDSFLLYGLGTPSVTVEVSRPGLHLLAPWRTFNLFWIANPLRPERDADNVAGATLHALAELLERTGGEPCRAALPELARRVPDVAGSRS